MIWIREIASEIVLQIMKMGTQGPQNFMTPESIKWSTGNFGASQAVKLGIRSSLEKVKASQGAR